VFSWLIVSLTFLITYEVFSRYALAAPHAWAFDAMIMMYGGLFMMAGAYTLSKNGHVRGDVLYGFFPPRLQAGIDLTLYIVFFLPGVLRSLLGRLPVRRRVLGDPRAFEHHGRRPAHLPLQNCHSRRRGFPDDPGHR
jgi:TRAP-type mannitol/chloroaromatic compound transport system permease small subunit